MDLHVFNIPDGRSVFDQRGGSSGARPRLHTTHAAAIKTFFFPAGFEPFLVGCSHLLGCNDTSLGET